MAVRTYAGADDAIELGEHLGARLASELIRGRVSIREAADQFIHDVQILRAVESGETVTLLDGPS